MLKNDISAIEEQFNQECTVIELKYEYPGYTGIEKYARSNTMSNYIYMYDTFVKPSIGNRRITWIKKSNMKAFYNYLVDERGLQSATIDSIHNVLHQMFDLAIDDCYIRSNPTENVLKELKRVHGFKKDKRRALSKEEQDLFLDYLKNSKIYSHWYPLFAVLIGTGLRIGELTGLRWCDVDLEKGIIDVNHTLVYYAHRDEGGLARNYYTINTPKTQNSCRQVPIMDFVKEAFLMEKEYQEKHHLECKAVIDGYTDFVFLNKYGNVRLNSILNRTIKKIIVKCNDEQFLKDEHPKVLLPNFCCHSLRHTFTTRMCEAGVNVKVMQDVLGHTDITTTLNIYTDVTKNLKAKEFEGLDKLFEKSELEQKE